MAPTHRLHIILLITLFCVIGSFSVLGELAVDNDDAALNTSYWDVDEDIVDEYIADLDARSLVEGAKNAKVSLLRKAATGLDSTADTLEAATEPLVNGATVLGAGALGKVALIKAGKGATGIGKGVAKLGKLAATEASIGAAALGAVAAPAAVVGSSTLGKIVIPKAKVAAVKAGKSLAVAAKAIIAADAFPPIFMTTQNNVQSIITNPAGFAGDWIADNLIAPKQVVFSGKDDKTDAKLVTIANTADTKVDAKGDIQDAKEDARDAKLQAKDDVKSTAK